VPEYAVGILQFSTAGVKSSRKDAAPGLSSWPWDNRAAGPPAKYELPLGRRWKTLSRKQRFAGV
jgi:hypothetical protein